MSFTTFGFMDDDEDDLFVSQSKSNVGTLFEGESKSDNASLSYQRKKQPKKDEKPAPKEDAKTVTTPAIFYTGKAELYVNSTYKVIGIAIVENKKQSSRYQLILYYTRESYVTTAMIRKDFSVTLQSHERNYYASFYDDQRKAWSLRFLNQDDSDNFGLHLAFAKYLDSDISSYILQDLYIPEKGHKITSNDKIAIDVVEYVLTEGKINENNITPNIVTFVGSSKNKKGWDIAIEGSRKLGKRIIVVQENSDIKAYKILITKLKRDGMITPKPQSSNKTQTHDHDEQESDPHTDEKVDLLRRVAKLGIQIPSLGNEGMENEIREYQTSPTRSSPQRGQSSNRDISPQDNTQTQDYYQRQNHPQSYQPQQHPENYQPYYPPNQQPPYQQTPPYQYPPNQYPPSQQPPYQQPPYQQPPNYYNPQQQYYNPPQPQNQYNPNQNLQLQQYQPDQNNQLSLSYPQNNSNNQYPSSQNTPVIIIPNLSSNQPREEQKKEQVVVEKEKPLITSEALQMIVEEKQLKSEIKILLDKIYYKLDEISRKLDETGYTNSKEVVPGITTRTLLQCIQKVVTQNEELNTELELKTFDDIDLDFDD